MTDWKLVGGVSLIGITMGWLGSRLIPVKDNPKTVPSIEKDDDLNWGGDPDGQLAKALAKARQDSKKPRKPLEIVRLDSETFEAEAKPKLTPTQLKYLNMMKSNYDGYAYVEVDNRGWKPYKTRPVQTLLDKKIISIPTDNNKRFYGRVENFKAYNVIINPIALKYKYTNPFDGYNFTDKFAEYMAKQQPQQTSQTSSSNEIEIKYYMESHNEAKNQHKYYIAFKKGTDYYTAYGRLPNYGRETTIIVNEQPNAEKMNEIVMKKMKTYKVERKDQIPYEIIINLVNELNSSLSPPKSEPKEETVDGRDYNPYERMIRKRMGLEAETKLKKESCYCGATKSKPCLCMIKGVKQCSAKSPMCPCYKEISMGTKVEMEHTKSKEKAEKIAKEHIAEHPDYYSRLKKAGLSAESFKSDSNMKIGNEILRQLGGRRFMMMVGAKQPMWDSQSNELSMKIGKNKLGANYFIVKLNSMDLYDLRFESRRLNRKTYEMSVTVKKEYDNVYADQLQEIFEQATGLYTRLFAESFEASIVHSGKTPKGAVGKAMLNQAMIEKSKVMAIIEELENKVKLGMIDENQLMMDLKRRFGAESTPITETDKYDKIASRFTLMELEIALVESLKAKDMKNASEIMKVIQRKRFINEYQAENNEER